MKTIKITIENIKGGLDGGSKPNPPPYPYV